MKSFIKVVSFSWTRICRVVNITVTTTFSCLVTAGLYHPLLDCTNPLGQRCSSWLKFTEPNTVGLIRTNLQMGNRLDWDSGETVQDDCVRFHCNTSQCMQQRGMKPWGYCIQEGWIGKLIGFFICSTALIPEVGVHVLACSSSTQRSKQRLGNKTSLLEVVRIQRLGQVQFSSTCFHQRFKLESLFHCCTNKLPLTFQKLNEKNGFRWVWV